MQTKSSAPVFTPPKTTLHTRNGQSYTFAETENERDEIFNYMISAKMCLRWGFRIPTEDPLNGQADPVGDRVRKYLVFLSISYNSSLPHIWHIALILLLH